jgi:23S rRNA pseudouridine1911/1915/1917 synthase
MNKPWVLEETAGYVVVYKPPRMHSAPLHQDEGGTLLDWCAALYPEVLVPRSRHEREGGLLHRLDFETRGLVLFARTQQALESLEEQQEGNSFIKEYSALTAPVFQAPPPGFPPRTPEAAPIGASPFVIESAFRAYGPGRKVVRPVVFPGHSPEKPPPRKAALDRGNPYRTEVLETQALDGQGELGFPGEALYCRLHIARGFRHQIRCHLAWLGHPILNDPLYGAVGPSHGIPGNGPAEAPLLALKAQGIFFRDPLTGEDRAYHIPPVHQDQFHYP